MANHPNRRSVNAAFFESFLDELQSTPTPSTPQGLSREDLLFLLKEAACQEAGRRLIHRSDFTDLWPVGRFHLDVSSEGLISVYDDRGNGRGILDKDEAILREELRRLTRGMPGWLPRLWNFLA